MTETLAAIAHGPHQPMKIQTVRLDAPRPNEVLVDVRAAGICHSDLAGRDQHMPFPLPGVLGHEGVGIVRAVGSDVTSVQVGDRVVMSQAFCGDCPACRAGNVTACPAPITLGLSGARADGSVTITDEGGATISGGYMGQSSWASQALVREPNVVRLPDDLPWEVAAPLACGVQTGAASVLSLLRPGADSTLVVFGAGTVGLSAVMAARHLGVRTIVVADPVPSRRALAEEIGATHTVDPIADDPAAFVAEITGGSGADFAIEASGAVAAGPAAMSCLGQQGTCLLLGVVPFGTKIELDWIGLVSGQKVLGAPFGGGSPSATIAALMELRAAGELPVEKLVTTYPFNEIDRAIADMESGSTIKPVLVFD